MINKTEKSALHGCMRSAALNKKSKSLGKALHLLNASVGVVSWSQSQNSNPCSAMYQMGNPEHEI